MRRYGRDYGGTGEGPARGSAPDLRAGDARLRQMRQEQRFQRERAAPGEDLGWGGEEGFGDAPRGERWGGRGAVAWQPRATPTAGDLMTENPAAVTPDTSLSDAARTMRDLDVGILPVVDDLDGRRLRGVITDRDIAVRAVAEGKDGAAQVGDCMTRDVQACRPDDRVRDLLHVMEREQVRRVPIVDHSGSLVGIVAQADLAVDFGRGEDHRAGRVETALERISAPARPRRRRGRE